MMTGRPSFFDVDRYLDCVEAMITCDEVERAFLLLDNMPAYYRDNVPERAREIRQSLHEALFTPAQYAAADRLGENEDISQLKEYFPPRTQILADIMREVDAPHLMEIGPGAFWLPHSLLNQGLKFSYEYQSLGGPGFKSEVATGTTNIFVAFELIEHLHMEAEIYQAYLKFKKKAQFVLLSTPLYTFAGGMRVWRGHALGHLRAYTPDEFLKAARGMFTGFEFSKLYKCEDGTMVIVGTRV